MSDNSGKNNPQYKHGGATKGNQSKEYSAWIEMKKRCLNQNSKRYADYGGRGITICERWLDVDTGFKSFLEDMGFAPGKDYSLERKEVNGNYELSNCKWATAKEQARNKRDTRKVLYHGKVVKLVELCEEHNVNLRLVRARIDRYGISVERAITMTKHSKIVKNNFISHSFGHILKTA